jgi:hypothetical protein
MPVIDQVVAVNPNPNPNKSTTYLFLTALPVVDQVVCGDTQSCQPGKRHEDGQKVRTQEVNVAETQTHNDDVNTTTM